MKQLLFLLAALVSLSSFALAEPARLTDAQLDAAVAGRPGGVVGGSGGGTPQTNTSTISASQTATATSTNTAACVVCAGFSLGGGNTIPSLTRR